MVKEATLVADERLAALPLCLAAELFAGKSVIVSGGGSGIGKAIAWTFARLGAHVTICGRKQERLDEARQGLAAAGFEVAAIRADIREEGQIEALFEAVEARHGTLDILVNNAGGQFPMDAIDIPSKGWRAVIENNLTGTWLMMQRAARGWRDAGRGGIIVNVAAAVERGVPGIIHTSAARAGIINAARTAAVEWAPLGIRVNTVAPGAIDSGGLRVYPEQASRIFHLANPQKTLGDPWDLAQMVGIMASDASRFMTGSTVTVDGGGALWGDLFTNGRPDYFESGA
ncbi:SDR family oxidoreductase [Sphingomonas sp. AOB5]|uniref:SDR family oxidoreductase n=1 Tax=Sphingomonas sp. AOB5 TaxID=3034017 RepID=UPI0023F9666C|nr:SDR family oxidoreductase [Sphingomonas sp. AOB5]MDF7774836.1 SDR family oxidoreductase [Sphingomonas sp. AOB5]